MATVLTSSAMRASLLRLPPPLRTATVQRSFSTTRPRQSTLVDIVVAPPTYLLNALHSTGLPWYAVLPTSAIIVRGLITYYITTLPNQKATQIQSNLQPIIAANVILTSNDPDRRRAHKEMKSPSLKRLEDSLFKLGTAFKLTRQLSKQFGASGRRLRELANFAMLIAMTEAIRMKCGSREGLLSLLLTPFQWVETAIRDSVATTTSGRAQGMLTSAEMAALNPNPAFQRSRDELMAERLEQIMTLDGNGNPVYDFSSLPPPAPPDLVYAPYTDLSMQSEGLGWITDLSAPDPTLTLPVLMWLALSLNVILRPTVGDTSKAPLPRESNVLAPTESKSEKMTEAQAVLSTPKHGANARKNFLGIFPPVTNLQRIGLCISMAFGFASMRFPAGILLYMFSSLVVGWLQTRWLAVRYPIRPSIKPCLRPLRLRVKRQWND
ncbi:hypothetical protein LTR78_006389 [Recurvomyces mirabilis]|uniref:Uncharacterized protein n=1 Tax=Recurvomyces mirabilis TaxID=574656 RepID=A0AAE0WLD4_9PEZI|nr:hypothetical protein LTR78_006389 [Recurvomyces mirabilis]KAK5152276.1 hypothetical protein LTS14_008653 [Recurvomyces mirabilis]